MYGMPFGSESLKMTRPTVVLMIRRWTSWTSAYWTPWSSRETVRSISSPVHRMRIGVSVSTSVASSASSTSSVLPNTRPSPFAPGFAFVR
jgi:hypothetical protein